MVSFDYQPAEKRLICTFSGRLDTIACESLGDLITEKLNSMPHTDGTVPLLEDEIIFDLNTIEFISSSFIRICIQTVRQAQKGKFSIIHSDLFIKKVFVIAGLDNLLKVS